MAVLGNRASGIMDYIGRIGADLVTPPQASPVMRGRSPLQMEMNRPEVQFSQPNANVMATTMPDGVIAMASPTPQIQQEMTGAGVRGPRMNPPQVVPARPQMRDMGGSGVLMTGPQLEQARMASRVVDEVQKNPGIQNDPTFMDQVKGYFGNRENMVRLAMAFNSMRLTPDQGLASALGSELKDIRAVKVADKRSNATLNALRQAGVSEKDLQVLANDPELLRKYAVEFFKKQMGVDPAEIQAFKKLTEGMSQEDIDRAKRIELGLEPRAGSQFALSLEELFSRSAAQAGGAQAGKSEEEKKQLQVQNDKTWRIWQTAISGLEESLGNTATGRVVGLLPAITSNQQIADQAIAIMAPVLKNIFRESGEGVFTDKDQQILIDMIPDRGSNPETIAYAIKMINDIVAAKLNQQIQVEIVPNTSATPNVLRFDAQGNPVQ